MRMLMCLICLGWLSVPLTADEAMPIHRQTLDNGLEVLVIEEPSAPIVTVQMWYRVGSRDEPAGRQGFAPLARQILDRGPSVLTEQTPEELVGRFGGRTDSYVSFDSTVFWTTVPANQLELALWLEAQRIANPVLTPETFEEDRARVIAERRNRVDARAFGNVYELICQALFEGKPYDHIPAGNVKHLEEATLEEIQAFLRQAFAPNNAALVVYGSTTAEAAMAAVKKYMGGLPRMPDLPARDREYAPPPEPRRVVKETNVPVPFVAMLHVLPGVGHEDLMAVRVLERVLATGRGSPFHESLVVEHKLAHQAASVMLPNQDASVLGVGVICRENTDPDKVEELMTEEFRKLIETGVSAEQLKRAVNQTMMLLIRNRQTMQGMGSRLGFAAAVVGRPQWVTEEWEAVSKVTAEDLQRVARTYLGPAHRMTLVLVKKEAKGERVVPGAVKERPEQPIQTLPAPVTQPTTRPAPAPATQPK